MTDAHSPNQRQSADACDKFVADHPSVPMQERPKVETTTRTRHRLPKVAWGEYFSSMGRILAPGTKKSALAAAQAAVPLSETASFPMWVMPVRKLLDMETLQPHEDVKSSLVQWHEGLPGKVLFVSHTWLRFFHPDSEDGQKIKLLQQLLTRAIKGQLEINAFGLVEFFFDSLRIAAIDLQADLLDGYVWMVRAPGAQTIAPRSCVKSWCHALMELRSH